MRLGDALVDGRFKLITGGDGELELYDLRRDPMERENVAVGHLEVVKELRGQIEAIRGENEIRRRRNLELGSPEVLRRTNESTIEQLRALGYVE